MMKRRKLLSFILAFCMVFSTVFAAAPAEAKWDDTYEQTEDAYIEPVYGLIATQYLSYHEDSLLLLDGYPADADEWEDNGPVQETIHQIDYTDFKSATPKGCNLWLDYRKSVTGERTHVSADDIIVKYYGDTQPSDENAQPKTLTGLLNDVEDNLVSFVPAANKLGYYTLSYKDAENADEYLTIVADYPTIGFYSKPERSAANLLLDDFSDNLTSNLPMYYGSENVIYMNTYGNPERKLEFPVENAEDSEPAFSLWLRNWDAIDTENFLTGGADDINDYLSVEEIASEGNDSWYKLTLADLPMQTEDGEVAKTEDGEIIYAKEFDLCVSMLCTNMWEEDGEPREDTFPIDARLLNAEYHSLGLTAKADGRIIADSGTSFSTGMIYPDHFVVSFEQTSVDADGNIQSKPVDMKKLKVEKDKNFGISEDQDWKEASDEECTITTNGNEVDCVFHYQSDWRFSFGTEEYIYIHSYVDAIAFWEEANRPADSQPVDERLVDATVDEGSTKKIYVLSWKDDGNDWAPKTDTIKIKAVANDKDVSDTYIKVDKTPITGNEGTFFGYGITITDAAAEDFKIIITAEHNAEYVGDIYCEFPVNVNTIKELTIATPPAKTVYDEGDSFNAAGMVVNAVYKDGTKKAITGYGVSATKALTVSDKTVTISYHGKNVAQAITVNPKKTATPAPEPLATGKSVTDSKTGNVYKVTKSDKKNPTVEYTAPKKGAKNTVTVPDTVTIDGIKYSVTTIAANAFKNNKKITKIVVGKNIAGIGKNAFSGCKKLKTITIKTTKLTSKNVKKDAFKGIPKKTVIQVPKKSLKSYKKLFPKKGLNKKIKIKK